MKFKNLFKRKFSIPEPGDQYKINDNSKDPFPPKKHMLIRVLEVKNGWVRYSIGDNGILFQDERMEVSQFVRVFTKI